MLHDLKELEGFAVGAADGELGAVKDFYFDDKRWAIRYLVVRTREWLSGRQVLISPTSVKRVAWDNRVVHVGLSRQQVRDSPSIDTDKPVSRQHEIDYYDYYGYPYYWEGAYLGGLLMYPASSAASDPSLGSSAPHGGETVDEPAQREVVDDGSDESHLRSSRDVAGHEAMASDGAIGSVQSFVFDDESWSIRYLILNTGNWLPGKRVLLSPKRIQRISWPAHEVYLDMTRQEINASPEYTRQLILADATRD